MAANRSAGFTLLEIAVVLAIAGLLIALVVPRLPDITATRAEAGADRISTTIGYLADEAALRGRVFRLLFDLDEERYDVQVHVPFADGRLAAGFTQDWDPYARPHQLPAGVELAWIDAGTGRQASGRAELVLSPDGGGLPVRIAVRGATEETAWIVVHDPLLGTTRIEREGDAT